MVYQHFQRNNGDINIEIFTHLICQRTVLLIDINVADVQLIVVFFIIYLLKEVIYGLHTKPSF